MEDENKQSSSNTQNTPISKSASKANESAGLNIDEHVKIFDPEAREIWLEKRA